MKKIFTILLVISLALGLMACGAGGGGTADPPPPPPAGNEVQPGNDPPPPPTDTGITVGFSQIGSESDWRVGNTESVRNAITGAGWNIVFDDANQEQHRQIQAIRDFITQGVDYIVFAPIVETGWDAIMQEIREAGIPVVMIDRTIDMPNQEDYYVTWITNNFEDEGIAAAQWLIDYLTHVGRIGENINIVELQGTVGSGPQILRQSGFAATIAAHPNLNISQSQTGNFETELGKTVMESFLARAAADGTPIDVVYAHNDGMALGAIQAIQEAGLTPGEDIIIIGIDAVKLAFEAILRGEMNVTVECSPLMGPTVVQVIQDHLAGNTPPKTIFNNVRVFDETLSRVDNRYLSAQDDLPNRVY